MPHTVPRVRPPAVTRPSRPVQAEGSQVPGHDLVSDDADPLAHARLWSRGNSAYGGGDGDFVDDAGLGIKVGSMKATGAQRTQMLLLDQADWMKPIDPYVAPMDLYLYWGESSARGTLASGFQGGRGRSSSGERVRRVLNFGSFTGNGYMNDASGHGRFLGSWTGGEFDAMSIKCCSTLLVPPMERNLPISSEQDSLARKIRCVSLSLFLSLSLSLSLSLCVCVCVCVCVCE